MGLSKGDSANELIGFVGDPNVSIQESKALTGDIRPGRRRRGHKGGPDRIDTSGGSARRDAEES